MFKLAQEAKDRQDRVLVTTSTKIMIPEDNQYDLIDLSGGCFADIEILKANIYVAGSPTIFKNKLMGCEPATLKKQRSRFDLTLIEADGAFRKPLKGWNEGEPVIPGFTTHTIGILDISTIGQRIDEELVHRIELFTEITGGQAGDAVSLNHLLQVVVHKNGLFGKARGEKILFVNKVETVLDKENYQALKKLLPNLKCFGGSIHQDAVHA